MNRRHAASAVLFVLGQRERHSPHRLGRDAPGRLGRGHGGNTTDSVRAARQALRSKELKADLFYAHVRESHLRRHPRVLERVLRAAQGVLFALRIVNGAV